MANGKAVLTPLSTNTTAVCTSFRVLLLSNAIVLDKYMVLYVQSAFDGPSSENSSPLTTPENGVQMFDVTSTQLRKRGQLASRPRPQYVPVEDGFITTAGKAERGAKYGNLTGQAISNLAVPPPPIPGAPPAPVPDESLQSSQGGSNDGHGFRHGVDIAVDQRIH
jgi:hypothetical protein